MKFCSNCGNPLDENAIFCPRCGARTNGDVAGNVNSGPFGGFNSYGSYPVYDTTESLAVSIVSYLVWEVGLILWLVFRHTRPGKARSAIKGMLASACVGMPLLGLALWLIWKDEPSKSDYVKITKIASIIGGIIYVIAFIFAILFGFR